MTRVADQLNRTVRRLTLGAAATVAAAALVVPTAFASPESDASDAINQAWQAAGASDSSVGSKDGDVFEVGGGYGQKFSDGKIFFSPASGAHLVYGAILDKYESLGGPADSDLDFPNIDEVAGLVSSRSRVSTFSASDKPAIFWTSDTGAWAVRGAINAAWDKLGGSAGVLGVPTEDERYDGDLVSQKFTGGQVSWNRVSNTFTTDPPELADTLTGLEVPLDPTTLIGLAWRTTGGLGGPLGARQGEQTTVGGDGAAQGYAGGKIFFSPQTGAHAVTGAILSKYESLDGPAGDLGYPVGTEVDGGVPNSRVSSFSAADKPVIFWTPDSGAIVVRGAINAAWAKLGGATGSLGVPTGEQTVKGDTVTQTFSGGEISWNNATKEFSSQPADLAASLSGLEMPDTVAQTPAAPSSGGSDADGGWHWWWLAILLPLLLLLGLLAVMAQRRAGTRRDVVERELLADEADDDFWPGTRIRRDEPRYEPGASRDFGMWSPPPPADEDIAGSDFDSGEDAIDTAPTRIPDVELTDVHEFRSLSTEIEAEDWLATSGFGGGRHSAAAAVSPSMWRLDLDEITPSRRRHAIGEPVLDDLDDLDDLDVYATEVAEEVRFESRIEQAPAVPSDESWRPAIHLPLADPYQAPPGYVIKGNTHSGLYYTPDSVLYDNTLPEVWFASEELARGNGFVKAPE